MAVCISYGKHINIEYYKGLDHKRPCFEAMLAKGTTGDRDKFVQVYIMGINTMKIKK